MKVFSEKMKGDLLIKNRQGWEISFNRLGADRFDFTLVDPWGIRHENINDVIIANQEDINVADVQALSAEDRQVINVLQQRMQHVVDTNHKFGLMVESKNGKLGIIFNQYGLLGGGGGRWLGFLVGGSEVVAGVALVVFTGGLAAVGGRALIGSGVNGCVHSVHAEDEDITVGGYVKASIVGAGTGAGGVVGNVLARNGVNVGIANAAAAAIIRGQVVANGVAANAVRHEVDPVDRHDLQQQHRVLQPL